MAICIYIYVYRYKQVYIQGVGTVTVGLDPHPRKVCLGGGDSVPSFGPKQGTAHPLRSDP